MESARRMRRRSTDVVERAPGWVILAAAMAMAGVVYALRAADHIVDDDELLLLVLPIVLVALRFGHWAGLAAASAGMALVAVWDQTSATTHLSAWAYAARAVAFFTLGGPLGRLVSSRRAMTRLISRAEEVSIDMLATSGVDGHFLTVNPAWERNLGYSEQELLGRPYLEFVHPDDVERTREQTAALARGAPMVQFRNRYRAADGSYRWLEWNAIRGEGDRGKVIYGVARDVTVQQQSEELAKREARELARAVSERTAALEDARLENLTRLALAADFRDHATADHTERVGRYAELIADGLGLDRQLTRAIRLAAPLHDIGKVGIPDHILLKPARLTFDEFTVMKTHTTIGAAILGGSSFELLKLGEQVALTHHEAWDGGGYPAHLKGEAIPIAGRIVAIADAFDAMTQARPYRPAMSTDDAAAELQRCAGTQFDPAATEVFLRALEHEPALICAEA